VPNICSVKDLKKVAIVGVGLLGGSIGLALPAVAIGCSRVGIGRRRSSLRRALRFDAIDYGTLSYARGLAGAQLVIVASPLRHFERIFASMAPHLPAGCVVTDVGSTKVEPARLAQALLPSHVTFIGSHPMAGSEKTGVEFSRADLFSGAPCVVTPTTTSDRHALQLVVTFWETLGCAVVRLSPKQHDEVVARVSHVTHLAASCLFLAAGGSGRLDLGGPGLMDTTRIASGDPQMWLDIMRMNRRPLLSAIKELTTLLGQARAALRAGDDEGLLALLTDAKQRRDKWIAQKLAGKEV